jgi:hypothetical protein
MWAEESDAAQMIEAALIEDYKLANVNVSVWKSGLISQAG